MANASPIAALSAPHPDSVVDETRSVHPPPDEALDAPAVGTQCPRLSQTAPVAQPSVAVHAFAHSPSDPQRYAPQGRTTPSVPIEDVRSSLHFARLTTQWPATQTFGVAQSTSTEHVVLHADAPHA